MDQHIYNVSVSWKSDRKGLMCSPELNNPSQHPAGCLEVATPPEFPKGIPGIWSPEHLFTAAVGSCLMTTFLSIAENSKLNFSSFECTAEGKLEQVDGKWLMTEVNLRPVVQIDGDADRDKAEKVLSKAEKACLISNSIRSKVVMIPEVKVQIETPLSLET